MNAPDRIEFEALADGLLNDAESLLDQWFPAGKLRGHEFTVGSLKGEPGGSLSINVNTGKWADFQSGEKGGDLISLYAAIHGMKQIDAARELAGRVAMRPAEGDEAKPKRKAPAKWTPILPVPHDAPAPPDRFARKEGDRWVDGQFMRRWDYLDAEGRLLGSAARFEWDRIDPDSGEIVGRDKDVVPQSFCEGEGGKRQWRTRSFPVPRPLYGLRELAERPDAPVMIVEGEKSADAARLIAPQYVVIAWPGGGEAWRKATFNPLRGRKSVLLWPDADEPGTRCMYDVGHELLKLVPTVKMVFPEGKADGWDAADALAEGWGWQEFKAWALPLVRELRIEQGASDGRDAGHGSDRGDQPSQGAERPVAVDAARGGARPGAGAASEDPAPAAGGRSAEPARAADAAPAVLAAGDDGRRPDHRDGDREDDAARARDRDSDAREPGAGEADRRLAPRQRDDGQRGREAGSEGHGPGDAAGADRALARAEAVPDSQVGKWLAWGLDRAGNGAPITNLNNAVAILEHDPSLRGLVWFDEFLQRLQTSDPPREWGDQDDINLTLYMQRAIGLAKMSKETVAQAVKAIAYRHPRNCARDWMESLTWDGTPRLEHFLVDVFGADENAYTRAASRNFWIAIAARVFKPGCQVDNMLVLEGTQGRGKSSAAAIIGGAWFAAQHESATNPRAFAEVLQGKMLVEIEEMDAFSRAETNSVKKAVSVRSDRFRPSGAHGYAKDHPRQCVFIGTTNRDDWNKDETGARRFWPIRCTTVELDLLTANREQYFAEAVARFKAGESWWEMPEEETRAEQRDRYDADPWLDKIAKYVAMVPSITVSEVMEDCLEIEVARFTRADQMRVGTCLRVLGWTVKNVRRGNRVVKTWMPPAAPAQKDATSEDATEGSYTQVVDSTIPF
jgi:putative DNA primase/helicase